MKKYLDVIIINGISVLIVLILILFANASKEIIDVEKLIAPIMAAGISISFGVRKYKIDNDNMFKELFTQFNKKYDKLNDVLILIENEFNNNKDKYSLNDNVENKRKVIDYLNLCSEEFLWKTKGRIDEKVWVEWEKGMLYWLNLKPIKEIVIQELEYSDSYYGLFEYLQKSNKLKLK